MIPLAKPDMDEEEITLVSETIRSGWITQGPRVLDFEKAFSAKMGAKHAVAVSNCTAALHIALLTAGVGPGDEVIVTPHSFIATSNSILYCGATPVFVDIDPTTLNMRTSEVASAITRRTKAILAVHQVGRPSDIASLAQIAAAHKLKLIEDAACAIGSVYKGNPIGDNSYSPLVCFSFHPRKILSTGDGGMITTGSDDIAKHLRLLRQHGMSINDLQRHQSRTIISEEYPLIGYNYRFSDLQAAIGIAQLRKLKLIVARRKEIAAIYDNAFAGNPKLGIFVQPPECSWNQQTYLIRLLGVGAKERDKFMQRLLDAGIASRRGIMSIHREAAYIDRFGYQSFPESESASDQCVCLPLYTQMSSAEIEHVCSEVDRNVTGR